MMIVRFLSWIFLEVRKSQNILGFWRVAWLVIPCHKWIFKSGFYDLILWIFPTICRNRARLTRKYTRVPRGRIYKEITHQNFESVNCSWNSSSWISVCRMKRRRTRKRRRRRRKQMNGSANWDLSTNLLVPDKKKYSSWQVFVTNLIFRLDGSDFCRSQGRFFWIFQQILWPVFFSQFISVWPPGCIRKKWTISKWDIFGTFLLVPGRLPWLIRTRIPTWKCSAPRLRWFCSWFLVYDLPGVRGKNVFQAYVKKQWCHGFYLEKYQIQKKTVLIDGCCFEVFLFFDGRSPLWWNVVPREDQRPRERGRGMKKERTMWRCRNATRFRTGFCCFRKL